MVSANQITAKRLTYIFQAFRVYHYGFSTIRLAGSRAYWRLPRAVFGWSPLAISSSIFAYLMRTYSIINR